MSMIEKALLSSLQKEYFYYLVSDSADTSAVESMMLIR